MWSDSSVGSPFTLVADTGSSHDWYTNTDYGTTAIAVTSVLGCTITDVDTWFTTRYEFDDCDPCDEGVYDASTVAMHEFGHWVLLYDIEWWRWWDSNCAMYGYDGPETGLCDHDIAGVQEIYGTD